MPKQKKFPNPLKIHTLVFDFDGVFTDNSVWVSETGSESVLCSRMDGLGVKMLLNWVKKNHPSLVMFILSMESNPVVLARANKLRLHCHQDVRNKKVWLDEHLKMRRLSYEGLIYLGNDLNDLAVIRSAQYSVVPKDAHPIVKKHAKFVLNAEGGKGFVRMFVEKFLNFEKLTEAQILELI